MPTLRLTDISPTVVLDGAGAGTVEVLVPFNQRWTITALTVNTLSQSPPIPTATVYRNSITASNRLDATYTGSQDTTDTVFDLMGGEKLVVRWTGGNPGDTARATIAGTREIR